MNKQWIDKILRVTGIGTIVMLTAVILMGASGDYWTGGLKSDYDIWRIDSNGDIVPGIDGTYDIGTSLLEVQDIYVDGTANLDAIAGCTTGAITTLTSTTIDVTSTLTAETVDTNSLMISNYARIQESMTFIMATAPVLEITGGACTIILPSTATLQGKFFFIKNTGGANQIVITPATGQTIDRSTATLGVLDADNDAIILYNGGSSLGWLMLGGYIQ